MHWLLPGWSLTVEEPRHTHRSSRLVSSAFWVLAVVLVAISIGVASTSPTRGAIIGVLLASLLLVRFVPIRWVIFIWPFSLVYWMPLVDINGYNITLTDLLTILLWLQCIAYLWGRKRVHWPRMAPQAVSLAVLALAPILGYIVAGTAIGGLSGAVASAGLFLKRWGIYTVIPIAAACTWDSGVQAWTYLTASSVAVVSSVFMAADMGGRTSGMLFNPNVLGIFAMIGVNLAVFMLPKVIKRLRWLVAVALLAHLLAIAASGSRTAWIAGIVSALYWAFQSRYRKHMVVGLALAVVILALPFGDVSRTRISDAIKYGTGEGNVAARLDAVQVGVRLFTDYPLGVGGGNIGRIGGNYLAAYGRGDYSLGEMAAGLTTTDNSYADTLIESGVVGFVLFVLFLSQLWRQLPAGGVGRASFLAMASGGFAAAVFNVPFLSGALWYTIGLSMHVRWVSAQGGSTERAPDNLL